MQNKFSFKKIFFLWFLWVLIGVFLIILINLYVLSFSKGKIFSWEDNITGYEVGIVFWARVYEWGKPSDILADRLKVAKKAYDEGKITKIIVSGDNSKSHYDEPTSMRNYLINLWVKKDDIYLDYAGFDTYDTLYRAREIFWVEKALLFTQEFHLKRALYIAEKLEIKSIWIHTDLQKYIYADYYERREVLARTKAFFSTDILKVKPKFLGNPINMNFPQTELNNEN